MKTLSARPAQSVEDATEFTNVGGNPAQPIRRRFSEDVIEALLEIKWWDWDIARISDNIGVITGGDLAALRRAAGNGTLPATMP